MTKNSLNINVGCGQLVLKLLVGIAIVIIAIGVVACSLLEILMGQ